MKLFAYVDGKRHELETDRLDATLDAGSGAIRSAFLGDRRVEFGWSRREGAYAIVIDGVEYRVEVRDALAERAAELAKTAARHDADVPLKAPIPGLVRRVLVEEGQRVAKDQPVVTLDAMKLENELPSPREGVVKSVKVTPGTAVEKGQVLLVIG